MLAAISVLAYIPLFTIAINFKYTSAIRSKMFGYYGKGLMLRQFTNVFGVPCLSIFCSEQMSHDKSICVKGYVSDLSISVVWTRLLDKEANATIILFML